MKTFSLSRAVVTVILSVCAIAGASGAQVTPPAAFLARAAGVYKEQSPSENLLEVVSVDDGHAYIRLQLKFHNGPMGSIYGIATYSGHDSLVYDNGKMGNERCLLEITWSKLYVTSFPQPPENRGLSGIRRSSGFAGPDQVPGGEKARHHLHAAPEGFARISLRDGRVPRTHCRMREGSGA